MVYTNSGRTAVRDWLGNTTATQPASMLWGTSSTSTTINDTTCDDVVHGDSFVSTDRSVTRQVQWEGLVLSTEATSSTIRQVAIGTETTGTAGTLYIKEDISPIEKNDQFDLQSFMICEVA